MDRILEKLTDICGISGQDDDCGDVSMYGFWAALIRRSNPARGGYIYREDDQGFKDYTSYDTAEELDTAWAEVLSEVQLVDDENPSTEDYIIGDARGGYAVSQHDCRHIGTFDTREEAEDAIREHAGKDFRPNVWVLSDHGNFHRVEDFDWQD